MIASYCTLLKIYRALTVISLLFGGGEHSDYLRSVGVFEFSIDFLYVSAQFSWANIINCK